MEYYRTQDVATGTRGASLSQSMYLYLAISWVGTELPHPQLGADVKNSVSQCSVLSVSFMPQVVGYLRY